MSKISLPVKGDTAKKLGAYFAPLKAAAQATPNMTVQVSEGSFWTATNEHQEYIGGTSPIISAAGSLAKWVLVTVKSTGVLNIVNGVDSGTPVLPDPSTYKDELPIAAIFVGDTTTALTNDMIYDLRPLWSIPPDSVSQTQLDDFATITYVDNADATKADVGGTGNANFTLNVGGSAINDSGLYIDRAAGPDVAIRFNELAETGSPAVVSPQWEFTNDGTTWNPIGVASGSYYTKSDLNAGALDVFYYTRTELAAGALNTLYYTETESDANFSALAHTHLKAEITDLSAQVETINSIAPTLGNVEVGLTELNDVTISGSTIGMVIRFNGAEYSNTLLLLNDLADAVITTPVTNDGLMYNGSVFVNRPLVSADITDLALGVDYVTTGINDGSPKGTAQDIFGAKTFKDGIVVETSLVITGTNTSIQTNELRVTDQYIDINYGEVGTGVDNGTGVAGIRVDRGTPVGSPVSNPAAIIQWDEGSKQWEVGVEGNASPLVNANHNHTSAQISDFSAAVTTELASNTLTAISDVNYLSAPSTGDYLRFGATDWENKVFATDVTTELNVNNIDQMQDVTYSGLASNDFLQYNGAVWVNHVAVKADISDFVEGDFLHITGNEVKTGDLTINGDFTVAGGVGTVTTINSEATNIADDTITINSAETGNGVGGGSGTSGIKVYRGTAGTDAYLYFSEPDKTWRASHTITAGSPPSPTLTIENLSFEGHAHLITDLSDITVSAAEVNYLNGATSNIQTQVDAKIGRAGDSMDNGANLTFAVNGEVLGLPATPSATAASSKEYVDAQDTIISGNLSTHAADMTLHLTTEQNTFLDGLTLTGSPALVAADVNQLIDITSNVQGQLDSKANLITGSPIADNLIKITAAGDITDANVAINDAGTTVNDLWTANQIDTAKADTVHAHVVADVTDFATGVTTELASNTLDQLQDVSYTGSPTLITGEVLQWNGTTFTNVTLPASDVVNTPAGNIVATDVQAALNELDTEKAVAVVGGTQDNIVTLDASSQPQDSGFGIGWTVVNANFAGTPYTATAATDLYIVDATAGNIVINLHVAATNRTRPLQIKRVDSTLNTVTVTANGVETIDGVSSQVVTGQYTNMTIMNDGSAWYIL